MMPGIDKKPQQPDPQPPTVDEIIQAQIEARIAIAEDRALKWLRGP